VSALRWLAHGTWADAALTGIVVSGGSLALESAGGGFGRHGVAVLPAGRPDLPQRDSESADRWRRVVLVLAEPVPATAWLRVWTRVEPGAAVPAPPEPATDLLDDAPVPTPAGVWRAAAVGALDARVLCRADGDLWVAVELGGLGRATPLVADVRVETGDDGPVTALPVAYRATGEEVPGFPAGVDSGDGVLGRFLGLLGGQLEHTSSLLDELPVALSPAVAPDRADAPWLERLATWVALDPRRLPADDAGRREAVANAVARHARRGTPDGLAGEVLRETGIAVEISEPLLDAVVWRLDAEPATSALGVTTGLLEADPGPPALDSSAWADAAMLIAQEDAGLPVHARVAHRICVHVPGGSAAEVAAVDEVVQRERPAHVLARTCAVARHTDMATVVGVSAIPGPGPAGLANDVAHSAHIDGPGVRLGTARLPDPLPHATSEGEAS
jgi:phage tail-like protein